MLECGRGYEPNGQDLTVRLSWKDSDLNKVDIPES